MTAAAAPTIEGLDYLEHLGSGGYSDVFLYERQSPRMRVAVKVLKDVRLTKAEQEQFAGEAETMARLADHPYIVQVFSTGTTADGRPFLVMKYYPPPNLGERAGRERFSVAEVLRTGVQIASAVETAHRAGILHRDIKPANILVSQYGAPGLTDFGIAGHAAEAELAEDLGVSIPWSPPEVLSGASNGSPQSDVYSLAATLWHLLVGRSPFEIASGDNSPRALMGRVLRIPPPPTGRADVPASLDRLLQQAMAKNPGVRPRSALELARALQAVEQEQRFPRTDIVVEALSGRPAPSSQPAARPATDSTRLRAPRVTAQPAPIDDVPVRVPTRSSARAADPPTARRPAVPVGRTTTPQTGDPATVLRPAVVTPGDSGGAAVQAHPSALEEPTSPRRGVHRGYVALLAAVVAIAAVVIGVVVSTGGSGRDKPTKAPVIADTEDLSQLATIVSPPVVRGTYAPATKTNHFTWTSPDSSRSMTYRWYLYPTGRFEQSTATTATSLDIKGTPPATTCIKVVAVPGDGSAHSDPSAAVCGDGSSK